MKGEPERSLLARLSAGLLAGLALVLTASAWGQAYPIKPIRFVVPWAAGGPPDSVGRLLGNRLGDTLKQQIVIDNRPGANSIIGTEFVARSAPDGYTYLLTTGSHTPRKDRTNRR